MSARSMRGFWREGAINDEIDDDNDNNKIDDDDAAIDDFEFHEKQQRTSSQQHPNQHQQQQHHQPGSLATSAARLEYDPAVLSAAKARIERGFEDTVRFDLVVRFCEQLGKTTKHDKRRELIVRMFATWRGDKFVLLRLLLPHLDKERQSYGMKESVLARMYVDLLTIAVTSDHARQLLQWKRPSSGRASGDFGAIVEQALHSRLGATSTLTVGDLNRSLDQLARAVDRADKKAVLNHLLLNSTAREQKWIVRIVLKELKLGVSEKTFLKAFHVDAEEYFNITSSLRKVCDTLIDPAIRLPRSSGIALFHPIKPMLAARPVDFDAVPKLMRNGPFGIELKYDGERIQVHKDGNTVRLFTRRANEYTDKYITLIPKLLKHIVPSVRNCIIDGELMVWDTVSGAFEQFGHLKTFANYDKSRRGFEDNDDDRSDGGNVNTDEEALMVGKQYCYVAFDLLYINDKPLCDLQLRMRRELLRKATTTTAHEFELSQMTEATTKEEIVEALDLAISNREEGIMVKDLASTYLPNDRGRWIKIKPEYIQGVGDDFDLLILGGFYGSGKRSGVFSGFLVGASVPDPEQEHALAAARASAAAAVAASTAAANGGAFADADADLAPIVPPSSAHPKMFYSVAKVATGYSIERLKGLNRVLEAHWHVWDPKNPPKHLTLGVQGAEVPDRWIDPKYSKVLQIKAAQIAQTTKYGSGFTLRFPRVTKIRYDKHWYDCMTLSEFQQVAHTHDGRYARRTVVGLANAGGGGGGDGAIAAKGRKRRAPGGAGGEGAATSLSARQRMLLPSVAAADVSDVRAASQIFAGHEFCVYSGDVKSPNKQELERLIVANGGTVVQEPLASTYAVIAGLKRTVKIRNLETHGQWNIIIYTWVTGSVIAGEMLELEPAHMIFTNAKQRQRFTVDIDAFGDSYTRDTRPDELQRIMAKAEPFNEHTCTLTPADKCVVEEAVWKNDRPWQGMFRPFLFYIDVFERVEMAETATADELIESGDEKRLAERPRIRHSPLELSERLALFYGARVVSAITRDVSHIIVDAEDRARMSEIRRACRKLLGLPRPLAKHVVRSQWIDDCVSGHEAWDETQYIVRDGGGVSRLASQVSASAGAVHEASQV